jgi:hypothetical protein
MFRLWFVVLFAAILGRRGLLLSGVRAVFLNGIDCVSCIFDG